MDKSTLLSKLYDILLENEYHYCGILDLNIGIDDNFFTFYGFTNSDITNILSFINYIEIKINNYEEVNNYKVNKYGLEISKLIINKNT